MKKSLLSGILGIVLALSSPVIAEEITIVGTGSGAAILKAVGAAFSQDNPGVTVNVPKSIGSGGGVKAVGRDKQLIGRVARQIKDGEQHFGLTYVPFAKMPIVFFTNKSVEIKNLSSQQVCDIYSGKVTNWKEAGGKNARIKLVRREDGDSSLSMLLKLFPGFKNITITPKSKTTYSDPDTLEFIQKKAGTIAFGTYGNAKNYQVNILDIDGKSPTDPAYQCFGTLALIFKEKNKTQNISKFVKFATSPAAHDAIRNAGGIPF
ncbi:MAG: phosphate ABC transporter substrate-binding protein [Desulfobacterales bacterium]|nr:phosphate ABC transporter substrate-binding protein [Desulfobacterales bacterium]